MTWDWRYGKEAPAAFHSLFKQPGQHRGHKGGFWFSLGVTCCHIAPCHLSTQNGSAGVVVVVVVAVVVVVFLLLLCVVVAAAAE